MGGSVADPSYRQVASGGTGHAEVVRVVYDPARVDYAKLLDVFWRNVDPVAKDRQFCDVGDMYRSAIFVHDAEQRRLAEASKTALEGSKKFDRPIETRIEAASAFYAADEGHQDYYQRNPVRYKYYKWSCGRAQRLEEIWGKPAS
jgi:peptide-methionine (S)-S-oxide reductase